MEPDQELLDAAMLDPGKANRLLSEWGFVRLHDLADLPEERERFIQEMRGEESC